MTDKICKGCSKTKDEEKDFYHHKGNVRSKCKACIIKYVGIYQKRTMSWKNRIVDGIEVKSYMKNYYENNKEKYAEQRRKFNESHPDYHRDYYRNKKKP